MAVWIQRLGRALVYGLRYLWVLVLITALCWFAGEEYPFSPFPMYDTFSEDTFYVRVLDKDGKPIPVETAFVHRTGRLKKIYESGLRDSAKKLKIRKRELPLEEKRKSGDLAMKWLWDNAFPEKQRAVAGRGPFTMEEVWIEVDGTEITEDEASVVGSFDPKGGRP